MRLGYPRHGLRVTVRLHGAVVGQHVLWAPPIGGLLRLSVLSGVVGAGAFLVGLEALGLLATPVSLGLGLAALAWPRTQRLGEQAADAVPTPDGRPLATVRWAPGRDPVLQGTGADSAPVVLGAESAWRWAQGDVEVDVQAQHQERARRLPLDPTGDMGMVVACLALYVAVMQAGMLVDLLPGQAAAGADGYELSPELIARLLERDLEGEEQAIAERVDRPEYERQVEGVFLPAGNVGTLDRVGGGEHQGPELVRTPPPEELEEEEPAPAGEEEEEESLALAADPEAQDLLAPTPSRPDPLPIEVEKPEQVDADGRPRDPMERFIGWGFRDWFDAAAREQKLDPRVERQLQLARARLRLDPDDYGALQVVGHYAYLAENNELCRSTYERLTEIFPEDSAGFNNLALTYKRDGEYVKEEELYRKALDLEPADPVVLNNLAVNLAHQQRFEEALGIMELLEEIDPDDPYSDLHRAKVYAAMGKREKALKYLKRALEGVDRLDTLHHIEFRQDLRLEPLLAELRTEPRYERLLRQAYGPDADAVLHGPRGRGSG